MPKGIPNKLYTPEFKKLVVETRHEEKRSYRETDRCLGLPDKRAQKWEHIYLEEGPGGFAIERRGRISKGRPRKIPEETEGDLIAKVQRLRAENCALQYLLALVVFLLTSHDALCKSNYSFRQWCYKKV